MQARGRRRPAAALAAGGLLLTAGCTAAVTGTGSRADGTGARPVLPSQSASAGGSGAGSAPGSGPASGSPSGAPTAAPTSADDLVDAMTAAMTSAPSGWAVQGTYVDASSTAVLDLRVQGGNGSGTVVLDGQTCHVVSVAGTGWAQAPAAFWTGQADVDGATADRIADRWVRLEGPLAFVQAFVDQRQFIQVLLSDQDDFRITGAATVDGVPVTTVDGTDETLSITTSGSPLLRRVSDDAGQVAFTFPTDPLQVSPPPADQTVPFPG